MRETTSKPKKPLRKDNAIQAIIFDLDDTLIHSTIDFVKLKRKTIDFYFSLGIPSDVFPPNMKTYEILQKATSILRTKGCTPREISRIVEKTSRLWDQIELEHVTAARAVDGAKDILIHLKQRNYAVGVVTRSCRSYALKSLKLTGLLTSIDVIVARNESEKEKPEAEPLLQAMKVVGSKAVETIMVGDSITDFYCSQNAGVHFIGVARGNDCLQTLRGRACITIIRELRDLIDLFA